MEATSPGRSRRRSRRIPEQFNPYLIISSNEDKNQMKQFFESRISPSMQADLARKESTDKKEVDDLQRFEDQVDKFNKIGSIQPHKESMMKKNKSTLLADYLIEKSKVHEQPRSFYDDYLAKTDKIIYANTYQKKR